MHARIRTRLETLATSSTSSPDTAGHALALLVENTSGAGRQKWLDLAAMRLDEWRRKHLPGLNALPEGDGA